MTSWTTGDFCCCKSWIFEGIEIILIVQICRNSKFDVDFVDFNRKIDNLTEKVKISKRTAYPFLATFDILNEIKLNFYRHQHKEQQHVGKKQLL